MDTDRQNTSPPKENGDGPPPAGGPDTTLGGYFQEHSRPPAFEGIDGEPYTVAVEVEMTPDLNAPYEGYLVFPRWATTGLGVVGHAETPTLLTGRSKDEVVQKLHAFSLSQVKRLLDEAIARRHAAGSTSPDPTE
jgi:hypothetical protein